MNNFKTAAILVSISIGLLNIKSAKGLSHTKNESQENIIVVPIIIADTTILPTDIDEDDPIILPTDIDEDDPIILPTDIDDY
ncbi:hypothetical protein [Saccharicrinis aurantiacus]|uniref:hypothetical protein n=1 Tax=Saccharicrinis aurantiacus TaxID=1849719 RepID=UPI000838FDD9|nr:hypothetical protein [Saccharicrinis aurantiacus]